MAEDFVHLHNHTEYSMLDGAARIPAMISRAVEMGYQALAITDHGGMYGVIPFYKEAVRAGIKPIIGVEVYYTPGNRFDRKPVKEEPHYHLLLLAEDNQGYRNLMKLVTRSYLEGYYYKPRVDREILAEHSEGVICLTACVKGEIPTLLAEGDQRRAEDAARSLLEIYGYDHFFLELQDHGLPEQKVVNPGLRELAQRLGVGLVVTNDVHYVNREDHLYHDVLLCIQTNSTVDQENRLRFSSDQFYLKSPQEMREAFPDDQEALKNSNLIAERCNVEIEFGNYLLPRYEVPPGYGLDDFLEKLAWDGLHRRYGEVTPELEERLRYELSVIREMGFSGYFLIVWDFIRFARENGIVVGPGRGSAAGSLVAYCLGITSVDPIKYDLLFERFLNPSRRTMPDIDIDFCYRRRPEVIQYVSRKYGEDRVAQIVTFSTMAARAAIRDAGRVYNVEYGRVDRLAKMVPEILNITIDEALATSPELKEVYEKDDLARKIIDTARHLEGIIRQDSIHAAGVVIAHDELSNHTPLQRRGPEEEVVTQYDMEAIQDIGLLKMDFLGLRTLTVISDTLENIRNRRGEELDIESIPLDDPLTFQLLQRGDTVGVFQLESPGMRALLQEFKPDNFEDLIAVLALYRPGPLGSGMVKDFVNRKRGRTPITYIHPDLEPILKPTYGVLVYQEQVMRIAVELAGYSMAEADNLRKAIAKSKAEELKKDREKFVLGMVSRGYEKELAETIFDLVEKFGNYGFNKSHSTAYAVISYRTAYLKAHYPIEFMAALLSSVSGNKDKVPLFINECRKMGIKVLPPDVNESLREFTPVEEGIRFGLSAVRNIGDGPAERIIAQRREGGPYRSLLDFCERVGSNALNKRALESLIKSGAFDCFGYPRNHFLKVYEKVADLAAEKCRTRQEGQDSLFCDEELDDPVKALPLQEELPKDQLLEYEKEMLGVYVTDHPLMQIREDFYAAIECEISELVGLPDGAIRWIGGIVANRTQRLTRKGELMAHVVLEDLTGRVEVTVFPTLYMSHREQLEEGSVICVKAKVESEDRGEELRSIKVVAVELAPLGERKSERQFRIDVEEGWLDRHHVDELRQILNRHRGEIPVKIWLRRNDGKVQVYQLPPELSVEPSGGLYAELLALVGEGCFTLS